MALPTTYAAYQDCFDHFERAKNSKSGKGTRILCTSYKAAAQFQMRMHQARAIDRRESKRLYEQADPRWGKSEFDSLKVCIRPAADPEADGGTHWIYIIPWVSEYVTVEELE